MTERFDFDVLDAALEADKIEEGKWLHLKSADDGPELYMNEAGKPTIKETPYPCRVLVRSTASKAFDEHLDKVQRRAADRSRAAKGRKGQEEMLKQLKKERPESFAALAVAFENVSGNHRGEIRPSRDEMIQFAQPPGRRWIVDQVLEFASELTNFSNLADDAGGETGNADAGASEEPPAG